MQEKSTQSRLEKTLARYVAMPTVPTDVAICTAAIKSLSNELEKLGMITHVDDAVHPWLIATTAPEAMRKKRVKVLFTIHFDVVPFENEGQLVMRATKDKLYGRGVYDMKFAAACVKEMIADYAQNGTLDEYDFGVLITTDEEKGGYDGVGDFLSRGWATDIAVVPDGGWNWSIEARAKGFAYVYLTAKGRAAHSSRPWFGDNPISRLSPAVDEITKNFPNTDELGIIVSVNSLETSNGAIYHTTQVPGWAKAGISVRAFTHEEMDGAIATIKTIAQKYNVEAEVTINDSPVRLMAENPLVQEFISIAEQVHGAPIKKSDALAASDARHLANYNIPTVVMYPGGGDHHGPQEWIVRNDLYKYYKLCRTFVEHVAHTKPTERKIGGLRRLLRPLNRR